MHARNIQALAIEMYKVAMYPEKNEIFQPGRESHNPRPTPSEFIIPPIHSVYHGMESVSFLGPEI